MILPNGLKPACRILIKAVSNNRAQKARSGMRIYMPTLDNRKIMKNKYPALTATDKELSVRFKV